jgi:hypothetical protein
MAMCIPATNASSSNSARVLGEAIFCHIVQTCCLNTFACSQSHGVRDAGHHLPQQAVVQQEEGCQAVMMSAVDKDDQHCLLKRVCFMYS